MEIFRYVLYFVNVSAIKIYYKKLGYFKPLLEGSWLELVGLSEARKTLKFKIEDDFYT